MRKRLKAAAVEPKKKHASPFVVHTPTMLAATSANPVKYNPRKISPTDFEAIKLSIKTYGFVDPIVVQRTGMNIIGGHQRVRALIDLCRENDVDPAQVAIPMVVIDVDDRAAKKLNIALNNAHGEFDSRLLRDLLLDLQNEQPLASDEILLMGFDDSKIVGMLAAPDFAPETEDKQGKLDEASGMSWLITCPSCGHEFKQKK
jgi:ParB-like chromosome segregation protein Spo0J